MTSTGRPNDLDVRVRSIALIGVGILWLAVAGLIAVAIRLGVPTPAELLRDVADRRAIWIAANVVLIVQQAALALAAPALIGVSEHVISADRHDRPGRRGVVGELATGETATSALTGMLLIGGGAFVASGVVHGVFGAHLASKVTPEPIAPDLVTDAELLHALGDTFWFVGVGAMLAVTSIVSLGLWVGDERGGHDRLVALLGAGAVIANLLQFGWFVDHVFGVFAAPGTLLQAAWFAMLGYSVGRRRRPA